MKQIAVLLVTAVAMLQLPGNAAGPRAAAAGAGRTGAGSHDMAVSPGAPSVADFGNLVAGVAEQYAQEHGSSKRIRHVDCVQASPGRYMCSYAVVRAGAPRTCHLIQARWTPKGPSTFTVTLAGRTKRCGSLREALRSLP